MLTLLVFSFLAGIATVFSPCVLPVLPALLGAGFVASHQRAYGVIMGFILSFTIATLTLSQALQTIGVSGSWPLAIAVMLLAFFGLAMLWPALGDKMAAWAQPLSAWGQKIVPQNSHPTFWSGLALGAALGLIWTPCAGPILATVIILAALQAVTFKTILITLAYAAGTALPMLLILRGSGLLQSLTIHHPAWNLYLRRLFGVLTLFVALVLALQWDKPFQVWIAEHLPPLGVENNTLVQRKLSALVREASGSSFVLRPDQVALRSDGTLPVISPAPPLEQLSDWMNSPPLALDQLRGKIVLVDFWTYSCINCLRTLPHLSRWYQNYKDQGLVILGIHTPEFAFEKDPFNVAEAIKRYQITYPVALDNQYGTWQAYSNNYWPAHYLIDQQGQLRYYHFGEGSYMETENAIRQLIGLPSLTGVVEAEKHRALTSEIYLGYERGNHYPIEMDLKADQVYNYPLKDIPRADEVALKGPWEVSDHFITAAGDDSYLYLNFIASRVHAVLQGASDQPIGITLDGKLLPSQFFTSDMTTDGGIVVSEPRKYDIVDLKQRYGRHQLRLHVPPGVQVYTFTFDG